MSQEDWNAFDQELKQLQDEGNRVQRRNLRITWAVGVGLVLFYILVNRLAVFYYFPWRFWH